MVPKICKISPKRRGRLWLQGSLEWKRNGVMHSESCNDDNDDDDDELVRVR